MSLFRWLDPSCDSPPPLRITPRLTGDIEVANRSDRPLRINAMEVAGTRLPIVAIELGPGESVVITFRASGAVAVKRRTL